MRRRLPRPGAVIPAALTLCALMSGGCARLPAPSTIGKVGATVGSPDTHGHNDITASTSARSAAAPSGTSGRAPRSALEILDRPGRAEEERKAWFPAHTEPIEAWLAPPRDAAELAVRTREVSVPWGMVLGLAQWMDNRYVMIGVGAEGLGARGEIEKTVSIVDTETATLHAYKPGQFVCYRLGRIIYESGPALSYHRVDVPGWQVWSGEVRHEQPRSHWIDPESGGKARRYALLRDTCTMEDPRALRQRDKDIGGVFYPEPRKEETPVWKRLGLLPEHGFLANHLPTVHPLPFGEPSDAHAEVHWFRPDGGRVVLPLSLKHEVGKAGEAEWAPWLGRYVFSGSGVGYAETRNMVRSHWTPSAIRYGREGNVVLFDPRDGDIRKVRRPPGLLHIVQLDKAFATRKGLLWQSAFHQPWGLYLSKGHVMRRISDRHARRIAVSPDGCRAVVTSYRSRGQAGRVNRLEILDFCGEGR